MVNGARVLITSWRDSSLVIVNVGVMARLAVCLLRSSWDFISLSQLHGYLG